MTTVAPRREWRSPIRFRISAPVRESRLPVGSSASRIGGLNRQGAGNGHALALAARELFGQVCRPVVQLDERQQLTRPIGNFLAVPPAQVQWQADVLEAGERRQQIEELEDEADLVAPDLRQAFVRQVGQQLSVDLHGAGARPIEPANQVQKRRLARPGGADNRHHLATRNRQADVVECGDAAFPLEGLRHPVELNHPCVYRTVPPAPSVAPRQPRGISRGRTPSAMTCLPPGGSVRSSRG